MSEFTYLFRGGLSSASPEQREQHLGKWMAWFTELGKKGVISDPRNPPGHPLENVGKVVRGTQKNVTDGPYAEAKDIVGGYILVNARDLAHAVEISKGCPILEAGGSVEVRPVQMLRM
jgi:hypothetical protein